MLQTIADSAAHMTADMLLSFLHEARATTETGEPPLAATIVERMSDATIATFVADSSSRIAARAERLALAFQTLVPETERKERLLDLAKDAARSRRRSASESGFEEPVAGRGRHADVVLGQEVRVRGLRPRAVRRTHPGDRSRAGLRRSAGTHPGVAGDASATTPSARSISRCIQDLLRIEARSRGVAGHCHSRDRRNRPPHAARRRRSTAQTLLNDARRRSAATEGAPRCGRPRNRR